MKVRLNSESSKNSVNEDSFKKISLESNSRLLPIGEINKVINSGEQFNKERLNSTFYRFTGTINTLFNNSLVNISGDNSLASFNDIKFRDETFPSDATVIDDLSEIDDISYSESIKKYLKEDNGWLGFNEPDTSKSNLCSWVDLEPNRDRFTMTPKNNIKNWELTLTYPVKVGNFIGDINHYLVKSGLLVISVNKTVIGNRNMVTLSTPIKHGLSQGDTVEIKGTNGFDGDYSVMRVGKDNGDEDDYHFSLDIDGTVRAANNKTIRMKRVVSGNKSVYYIRKFKKIKTRVNDVIENDDYEIYPLAFHQTIYEDKVPQYVFNEDVDVSDLRDNLSRPLSELYLTILKTNSVTEEGEPFFTDVKSGIKSPIILNDVGIPDIRRITNTNNSNIPLEDNVTISDDEFYGDVAEFNVFEFKEVILSDVYHRFNTINRETEPTPLTNYNFKGDNINLGVRHEGYMYKAHHKIEIRSFSNYVEEGFSSTTNKPDYARNLGNGKYVWRDLLDIGVNDIEGELIDYPFLNNAHYVNNKFNLRLERQDPFNFYGLQYTNFPSDVPGNLMEDNIIIKRGKDIC